MAAPSDVALPLRWGRTVARRRYAVIAACALVLVALIALWQIAGAPFSNTYNLPGTETQQASDLIAARFPQLSGDTARIVFHAAAGVNDPAIKQRIAAVLQSAQTLPHVIAVGSPYGQGGAISSDGTTAYAVLQYDAKSSKLPDSVVTPLFRLVDGAKGNGLDVETGGTVVEGHEKQPDRSEVYGMVAAAIILLIAFGSVVAMGLPLATALAGLLAGFAAMGLLSRTLDLASFAPEFVAMIGLGVGIDYALLIVTRYRELLAAGASVGDAVGAALNTAGRSVLFAGSAVAIAMLGLVANGIPLITALGVVGALVVVCAIVVAWTLLPALLALSGRSIDRWGIKRLQGANGEPTHGFWYGLATLIQRRPWLWGGVAVIVLLVLAIPTLSLRLGASDAGNGPTSLHSRRAYDLLAQGFGPGFNGPLTIAIDLGKPSPQAAQIAGQVRAAVAADPGIAAVGAPTVDKAGDAATMSAIPRTSPQDARTQQLVHRLRTAVLPPVAAATGAKPYVAGSVAASIDIAGRIGSRMPVFFAVVIGLSFVLLLTVFRSLPVALTAAVMNVLSIGAAYGVLVAVFQWGWLAGPIGVKPGPIESFQPMMMFAIVFGLSMDYEVFLISRVREEYDRRGDNGEAVARGLASTARVIMSGASIMIVVFLSFVLSYNRVIKEFGLGLAAAVLVDATVVRLALVPAVMEILGRANWWMPAWLDRALPRLAIEGGSGPSAPTAEPQAAGGD